MSFQIYATVDERDLHMQDLCMQGTALTSDMAVRAG